MMSQRRPDGPQPWKVKLKEKEIPGPSDLARKGRELGCLYANTQSNYEKIPVDPALFKIEVAKKHLEHLAADDLDEISKNEVVYKILKDQLRAHQKKLFDLKTANGRPGQFLEVGKEPRPPKSKKKDAEIDWNFVARAAKPLEWFGSQRDLPDNLKRIVTNMFRQTQKYAYAPCCGEYEEQKYNPVESVRKFLDFMKEEYGRTNPEALRLFSKPKRKKPKAAHKTKTPGMPDDSCSDITDLDAEEIMTKLLGEKTSAIEQHKQERGAARRRLLGEGGRRHICSTTHRVLAANRGGGAEEKVIMEIRPKERQARMQDEENSAHQFSVGEHSAQADEEARLDLEIQAEKAQKKHGDSPLKSFRARAGMVLTPNRRPKELWKQVSKNNRPSMAPKLKEKDKLFGGPATVKTEMAIQTDDGGDLTAEKHALGMKRAKREVLDDGT